MKKIIIALICALCTWCSMASAQIEADTVLTVGQPYKGGVIKTMTLNDKFVVVAKMGETFTFPISADAEINDYYLIRTVYIKNGEVRLATGECPRWVAVVVIAVIIIAFAAIILWALK